MKSELNLFAMPPTQTSIDTSYWVQYKPISSLTNAKPIEFVIRGDSDEYIDLPHTLFYIKVVIETPSVEANDMNADAQAAQVSPINNFLHSLFDQVSVTPNHQTVSPPNNNFACHYYIKTLLNYGPAAEQSHLSTVLWNDDTSGHMDSLTENLGLKKRRSQ